jgi:hypothetical protein
VDRALSGLSREGQMDQAYGGRARCQRATVREHDRPALPCLCHLVISGPGVRLPGGLAVCGVTVLAG